VVLSKQPESKHLDYQSVDPSYNFSTLKTNEEKLRVMQRMEE
jgi:hypothetical protein